MITILGRKSNIKWYIIHYNLVINNLDTYNFIIIGNKISENNTNNTTNNKNPYVN